MNSYKDLVVWQKAIDLTIEIYSLTNLFPKEEMYGLVSQIRRSAVSIPSNIAEGQKDLFDVMHSIGKMITRLKQNLTQEEKKILDTRETIDQ